uniref:Uncharacterized protein n=1 Tax=Arundo donax TaxID=35708 RepID=A0A0A8ZQK0_ARUDO
MCPLSFTVFFWCPGHHNLFLKQEKGK